MDKEYEIKSDVNIWRGCILACIAHAIMVAHYPELSHEHSWDGINYCVQNSAGIRGTVSFKNNYCVAAFRNDNSGRRINTFGYTYASDYFKNANAEIVELAETETLQYLLDYVDGQPKPVITAGFWGYESLLFSIDDYDEMLRNGGCLLDRQMMDVEQAISSWKVYYGMSEQQLCLLKSIYVQKIENPTKQIVLSKAEIEMIGIADEHGLDESRISFEEINIKI